MAAMDDVPWIIARNCYGAYCVPRRSAHRPSARAAIEGRVWESDTVEFLRRNVGTGDVVHAGTYFGDFLPALSGAIGPGAIVWAFEPNLENYHATCLTCRINKLSNVKLTNAALWDYSGVRRIRTTDANVPLGGGSKLVGIPEDCPETDQSDVPVIALDEFLAAERAISLIHLDIEGAEFQALRGALKTIGKWKPLLVLETCPHVCLDENLVGLGYRVVGATDGNSILSINGRTSAH